MTGSLDGKVAIVTGAAQGIGRAYALALAAEGATVVAADLNRPGAEEAAEQIRAAGGSCSGVEVDVNDLVSTERMAAAVVEAHGGIDILVNNAAIYAGLAPGDPFDIDPAEWDRVMAVNVRGPWLCARAVAPAMRERGGGRIVNQSSVAAWGGPAILHYSTSKAAVIGLTRSLAKHLGKDGITVNAIAPGVMETESTLGIFPADRLQRATALQAVPRMGTPQDLVGALIFLCGDAARFITGQVVVVDGGQIMA